MSAEPAPGDPRDEYASLLRAAVARLELERSFGIEAWKLPSLDPQKLRVPSCESRVVESAIRNPQPETPSPPAPPPSSPAPVQHVATESKVDMFQSKDYDIQIPEGLSKQEQLDHFARCISNCTLCPLHVGRTQVVFGVGNPDADLMFVGEAPGHDEDVEGIPFVGRAGQLLTKIIEAMGFRRDEVYIANVNKCRPPNNRAPLPEEMDRCRPFLLRQLDIIQPKVICLLGATAVRGLLHSKESITRIRGSFIEWRGIRVMPTFHPAYLLRSPNEKRKVWEDVQKVRDFVRGA